tara:strand:- start:104 stop:1276 length:1173 start_codon:yes stop_codon:yes gene_type:complete
MLFQTLDNKRECYAVYSDGELYHYPNNLHMTETWDWTCHAPPNVDFAQVWCNGKSLSEVCPEELKISLQHIQNKARAFFKSFQSSKMSMDDVCFYDLVPKNFLLDYCNIKNEISKHVFSSYQKPKNYDFLVELVEMLDDISCHTLNFDHTRLSSLSAAEHKKALACNNLKKIFYNPWGSVTGRLTTRPNSFPILTLPRTLRSGLTPNNDLFVELDYNSAEMRTAFALLGMQQPENDIHDHLKSEVFNDKLSRDEVKQKVFAWLYNPKASNKKLQKFLDKEKILEKYYTSGVVKTPFDRDIQVEPEKALNYLVQSTTSDLFLAQAIKIYNMLKDSNSHIAFCIHDSLVLDVERSDRQLVSKIISVFSQTPYGHFKTNVSFGKDFGTMRKIK